ncbi:MAG: 50S ribosomal protein L19 [Gammaproteobacteria bacterium]
MTSAPTLSVAHHLKRINEMQLRTDIPDFAAGDSLRAQVRVTDGNRTRLQSFEGLVIAIKNRGLNSSFTLRRIAHGIGVERVFQTHSPILAEVTVIRRGRVRRAKLYYQRARSGRSARIREKITSS